MKLKTPLNYLYLQSDPSPYSGEKKIMIVLHGLGDEANSFIEFSKELNVTGLDYLLVDAPFDYYMGKCWYDPFLSDQQTKSYQQRESLSLMKELINNLNEYYSLSDTFIAGFSQGGFMALKLWSEIHKNLGGVVALSPRFPFRENLPQLNAEQLKTPIFMAHGLYDEVIPFSETEQGMQKLKASSAFISWHSYKMGHEIDISEIIDLREWINHYL